ncbi:MFS transporter [Kribbella solani]|uniref:MFS family permease n=1 Tax=Kribbella solani TaxID=236067 RepID=A0A841DM97_9ACTN|nr:MFS transporter [Kribbella solani]MBB5977780.1 MFS family permease [Kribbella solani]
MTLSSSTPVVAYRDGNVLRWAAAYTASVGGDVVFFLTLSWAVTRVAGPAQVGAVLAVGAIPRAVLMLAGGVIADRYGPRRVVLGSDLARCLVVFGAAALMQFAGAGLPMLFAIALVFGVIDALFMPAVGALAGRLTDPGQLGRVQGLRMLAVRLSNAVGPMIAAVVLTAAGVAAGFGLAGLLFSLSVGLLLVVRLNRVQPSGPSAGSPLGDLQDGLRHLRRNRQLARLVLVVGLGELCFSGPVGVGLVLLTAERHWSAAVLGWTLSAFSIGGAVAGILLTALTRIPRAGVALAGSLLATAVLVGALGQVTTVGLLITGSAALGTLSGVASALGNALLQRKTEPRYLGRVGSVTSLCTLGLSPLLYPIAGVVAAAWGTGIFFAGCALVCLLAAATAATRNIRGSEL